MSNNSWNEHSEPLLQPDPAHPGATVAREAAQWHGAVEPRRGNPETGFALGDDSPRLPPEEPVTA